MRESRLNISTCYIWNSTIRRWNFVLFCFYVMVLWIAYRKWCKNEFFFHQPNGRAYVYFIIFIFMNYGIYIWLMKPFYDFKSRQSDVMLIIYYYLLSCFCFLFFFFSFPVFRFVRSHCQLPILALFHVHWLCPMSDKTNIFTAALPLTCRHKHAHTRTRRKTIF